MLLALPAAAVCSSRLLRQQGRRALVVQVVDKLKGETRELAAANLAKSEEQAEIRNQVTRGCCVLPRVGGSWGCAVPAGHALVIHGRTWPAARPHRARMQADECTHSQQGFAAHPSTALPCPALLPQMAIIRSGEYAPAKAAFDDKWARQQAVLSKLSPDVLMRRWAALGLGAGLPTCLVGRRVGCSCAASVRSLPCHCCCLTPSIPLPCCA